jgi:hypothetical protein
MSSSPLVLVTLASVALVMMTLLYLHSASQATEATVHKLHTTLADLASQLDAQRVQAERQHRKARARAAADAKSESATRQSKLVRERDVALELLRVRESQRDAAVAAARRADEGVKQVKRQMRQHMIRLNEWSATASLLASARGGGGGGGGSRLANALADDDDFELPTLPPPGARPPNAPAAAANSAVKSAQPAAPQPTAPLPPPPPTTRPPPLAAPPPTPPVPPPTPKPLQLLIALTVSHDDGDHVLSLVNALLDGVAGTQTVAQTLVVVRNPKLTKEWAAPLIKKGATVEFDLSNKPVVKSAVDLASAEEQTTSMHLEQLLVRTSAIKSDFVLITSDTATLCEGAWPFVLKSISHVERMAHDRWGSVRFGAGLDGMLLHRNAAPQLVAFMIRYSKMVNASELVSQWIHGSWPGSMLRNDVAPRSPISVADFAEVKASDAVPEPIPRLRRNLLHFTDTRVRFQSVSPVVACRSLMYDVIDKREIVEDPQPLSIQCAYESIRPCW